MRREYVIALTLLLAAPADAESILDCGKSDADPTYCRDGKPRPICIHGNVVVWADTHLPVSPSQIAVIARGHWAFPCPEDIGTKGSRQ
jgi:hypothetical protein